MEGEPEKNPPPNNHRVDPRRFLDREMTLHRTSADSDNDYVVMITGLDAARIHQVKMAGSVVAWSWSITGPAIPRDQYPLNGMADTLESAKLIVRQKFNAWLMWAVKREIAAVWYGENSSASEV